MTYRISNRIIEIIIFIWHRIIDLETIGIFIKKSRPFLTSSSRTKKTTQIHLSIEKSTFIYDVWFGTVNGRIWLNESWKIQENFNDRHQSITYNRIEIILRIIRWFIWIILFRCVLIRFYFNIIKRWTINISMFCSIIIQCFMPIGCKYWSKTFTFHFLIWFRMFRSTGTEIFSSIYQFISLQTVQYMSVDMVMEEYDLLSPSCLKKRKIQLPFSLQSMQMALEFSSCATKQLSIFWWTRVLLFFYLVSWKKN